MTRQFAKCTCPEHQPVEIAGGQAVFICACGGVRPVSALSPADGMRPMLFGPGVEVQYITPEPEADEPTFIGRAE